MIVTIPRSYDVHLYSYKLLADTFSLKNKMGKSWVHQNESLELALILFNKTCYFTRNALSSSAIRTNNPFCAWRK